MLIAVTAMLAALPASPEPDRTRFMAAPVCQRVQLEHAGAGAAPMVTPRGSTGNAPSHELNREPDADVYAAVVYSEGDCLKPVKLRSGAPGMDDGAVYRGRVRRP